MHGRLISFISDHWNLIENPKCHRVNLRQAWRLLIGSEPDISVRGWTVVGVHAHREPGVRSMRFMWGANPRAVEHAATLIALKYGCEVEAGGWAQRSARPDQWIRDANPGDPGDVASLTIWPDPGGTSVTDSVVLELCDTPGSFIGANDQAIPVSHVREALRCPSLELAKIWMSSRGIPDQAVQPKWRSVAVAEEDQRLAASDAL